MTYVHVRENDSSRLNVSFFTHCHYCVSSTECPTDGAVRLAEGTERKGLLEICYNNTWGLVCDDEWNYTEALVVCKALNFPNASEHSCTSIKKYFF